MINKTEVCFSIFTCSVNEKEELKNVINRIYSLCDHSLIKEIIIIYSKTSPLLYENYLHSFSKEFPDFTFIIQEQSGKGLNQAIYQAFSLASGDCIIELAADGENKPEDVLTIMRLYSAHPGCIVTASRRIHEDGFKTYSSVKKICNDLFYIVMKKVTGMRQSDITYFFQGTPKSIIDKYLPLIDPEKCMTEICLLPELYNEPFVEFPSCLDTKIVAGKTKLGIKYYYKTCINICLPILKNKIERLF